MEDRVCPLEGNWGGLRCDVLQWRFEKICVAFSGILFLVGESTDFVVEM